MFIFLSILGATLFSAACILSIVAAEYLIWPDGE